jgi:hypothetical protein
MQTRDRCPLLCIGVTAAVLLLAVAAPAAHLRLCSHAQKREAAQRAAPLPCRYHREHGRHVLSFSAVRVDDGFNAVASAVDQGRRYVNAAPLFGRPVGTLRLVRVELETWCAYQGGRVVPGRADGVAAYSAVLVFAEHPEGSPWEAGEPLDVDRFIRDNIHSVAESLSP